VFITVSIPFFVVSMYAHDWPPRAQIRVIGALGALDALMLLIFAGILQWI
jgi:hypothetical protein